ncbi:sulfite exporter TauE/SafE family protein (plasmid) [Shinella sp. H4-D48]|uniref:sulfite exporter TauE/SafE family protein n=1 Tax=Shinella sp. H4-D48 TaxID=2925841 RepID=UPI001F5395B7|nr:sulfite exporter TauE/SafE family protein [Shinella sp. H4-D48]UNK39882.1 sulfite exporter TauE/SafE family protein [Shinella sp. H4-D48]
MINLSDPPLLVAVAATFLVAGIVKGVTGMGLPTVAMGVLGGLLSPLAAAALLVIPSFVTNVSQLLAGQSIMPIVRRLWPMMAGVVLGTFAGSSLLKDGGTVLGNFMLGLALAVYAVYTLLARPFQVGPQCERWLSPLVGGVTGLVTGATGVFVIPAVPYVQALGLRRDDLVQALGLSFTVSTVALATALGSRGVVEMETLLLSAAAVAPALLGMWMGQYIRRRVSPAAFKRCFLIALALLGLEMMLRGVL